MKNQELIVEGEFLLQKMSGKGGWTYVLFPELKQEKRSWFGMTKVCGFIDSYEIADYHLMPFGNGMLFLPVKAEIRKLIKKTEGDTVTVKLFSQNLPPVEMDDFYTCLSEEPVANERFKNLSEVEQKKMLDWIYSVRNDQMRVERIAVAIDKLLV